MPKYDPVAPTKGKKGEPPPTWDEGKVTQQPEEVEE